MRQSSCESSVREHAQRPLFVVDPIRQLCRVHPRVTCNDPSPPTQSTPLDRTDGGFGSTIERMAGWWMWLRWRGCIVRCPETGGPVGAAYGRVSSHIRTFWSCILVSAIVVTDAALGLLGEYV